MSVAISPDIRSPKVAQWVSGEASGENQADLDSGSASNTNRLWDLGQVAEPP